MKKYTISAMSFCYVGIAKKSTSPANGFSPTYWSNMIVKNVKKNEKMYRSSYWDSITEMLKQ